MLSTGFLFLLLSLNSFSKNSKGYKSVPIGHNSKKVNSKINKKKVSKKHKYAYDDLSNQVLDYYSYDVVMECFQEMNIYYNECHVMCQNCRKRSIQYQETEMAYATICDNCTHCEYFVDCENKTCICNKCDSCGGYDIDECTRCSTKSVCYPSYYPSYYPSCHSPCDTSSYSSVTPFSSIEYVLSHYYLAPNIRLGLQKALELIG